VGLCRGDQVGGDFVNGLLKREAPLLLEVGNCLGTLKDQTRGAVAEGLQEDSRLQKVLWLCGGEAACAVWLVVREVGQGGRDGSTLPDILHLADEVPRGLEVEDRIHTLPGDLGQVVVEEIGEAAKLVKAVAPAVAPQVLGPLSGELGGEGLESGTGGVELRED